jgi:hypothetical protein
MGWTEERGPVNGARMDRIADRGIEVLNPPDASRRGRPDDPRGPTSVTSARTHQSISAKKIVTPPVAKLGMSFTAA